MPSLVAWWTDDVVALRPGADPTVVATVGADLLSRWSEPHRRYHDTHHLLEMLRALDELGEAGELGPADARLARLAAWWHDAVYDPAAPDNEERSARLAAAELGRLGLDPDDVATVVGLVRMTATHDPADDAPVTAALLDADLWVLSAPPERYAQYAARVREEYAAVPDAAFRVGRAAVLRDLVGRERLYATAYGRHAWEHRARANVAAELARLSAG